MIFALNSSDFADNFEAFRTQNASKDAPHNAGNSNELSQIQMSNKEGRSLYSVQISYLFLERKEAYR